MLKNGNTKSLLRKMLPKIIKAAVKGALWFVLLYVIPNFLLSFLVSSIPEGVPDIFSRYDQLIDVFAFIVVFFVVASELTSGTIFQHAFNIGRILFLIGFTIYVLEGGIVAIDFQNINIVADLTVYIIMLLTINLLWLVKSVLQAINFLSERTESQLPTPGPSE